MAYLPTWSIACMVGEDWREREPGKLEDREIDRSIDRWNDGWMDMDEPLIIFKYIDPIQMLVGIFQKSKASLLITRWISSCNVRTLTSSISETYILSIDWYISITFGSFEALHAWCWFCRVCRWTNLNTYPSSHVLQLPVHHYCHSTGLLLP